MTSSKVHFSFWDIFRYENSIDCIVSLVGKVGASLFWTVKCSFIFFFLFNRHVFVCISACSEIESLTLVADLEAELSERDSFVSNSLKWTTSLQDIFEKIRPVSQCLNVNIFGVYMYTL